MTESRQRVRTVFLSDIHLGTRACQSNRLLQFLRDYEFDTLYLVGDIIDFWALKRGIYWPPEHNTVIQKILRAARHGARVIYIPGNHDEALRRFTEHAFGSIYIERQVVHVAADGKRYLVIHGDEYDQITTYARWLSVLGDLSYTMLLHLNRVLSWTRRRFRIAGHWSLADYAKRNVQGAASFISGYEGEIAHHVRSRGFDGVICGHIHTPVIRELEGIQYLNCGDWVDSCTAVVEHMDGQMQLVRQTVAPEQVSIPLEFDEQSPQPNHEVAVPVVMSNKPVERPRVSA